MSETLARRDAPDRQFGALSETHGAAVDGGGGCTIWMPQGDRGIGTALPQSPRASTGPFVRRAGRHYLASRHSRQMTVVERVPVRANSHATEVAVATLNRSCGESVITCPPTTI
jgi:hypothetical protein